jgi:hypothetical protein
MMRKAFDHHVLKHVHLMGLVVECGADHQAKV